MLWFYLFFSAHQLLPPSIIIMLVGKIRFCKMVDKSLSVTHSCAFLALLVTIFVFFLTKSELHVTLAPVTLVADEDFWFLPVSSSFIREKSALVSWNFTTVCDADFYLSWAIYTVRCSILHLVIASLTFIKYSWHFLIFIFSSFRFNLALSFIRSI